jgi:DNA repair protein RadC
MTMKLKAVGELLGIPVVDHLIITDTEKYYSFTANGELG